MIWSGLASATVSIAPNNAGIYYSPTTWTVSSSHAITLNAGSYFKTVLVATTTCVLNFNVALMSSEQTQIYWRVDRYGPWTKVTLSSGTVTVTLPSDTSTWPQHFLEVYVKSTSTTTGSRWDPTANPNVSVDLTSITLDNGASVTLPFVAPRKILMFGDSITEGVRTVFGTSSTDGDDSMLAYSTQLLPMLGAEAGIIGWGAQGWSVGGVGSVPSFPNTYNLIYTGVSRSFAGIDLIIINMGQNDGSTNTTIQVTAVLNGIASAGYTGTIILLEPFNDPTQGAFITAGRAAATNPSQSVVIDTTGFFNTALSADAVHPYGVANIAYIAPQIASAIIASCAGRCGSGWRRL